MWQSLHDAWWRLATAGHPHSFSDTLALGALSLGSWAYRAGVTARNAAYDRGWVKPVRLPCKVVSVGNLTVGGTGKTACVELIARKLRASGRRVAVLSRGYGGDEPALLEQHLPGVPVLVGARRDRTGLAAHERFKAEIVILDDGFQHRRVARDCEIVLVHGRTPLGGWALLPRGPMREPLESLARADIIVVTKADEALERLGALTERLRSLAPQAAFVTAAHQPVALLRPSDGTTDDPMRLSGMRLGLLSSIGDPAGFEATVQRLHATFAWHEAFPDHHPYRPDDWAAMIRRAQQGGVEGVVTTEKDWVRLAPVAARGAACPVPLWVVAVRMQLLSGEQELDDRLARLSVR